MTTAKDELVARLTGRAAAQAAADKRTQEDHAKGKQRDDAWVTTRARELQDNGVNMSVAYERAQRELRAKKLEEGHQRDRARVDEAVRQIEQRDREAVAADSLRERLHKAATTSADHEKLKAAERQRRLIAAELDSEES